MTKDPALTPLSALLSRIQAREGASTLDVPEGLAPGALWGPGGVPVALGRQTMVVFG